MKRRFLLEKSSNIKRVTVYMTAKVTDLSPTTVLHDTRHFSSAPKSIDRIFSLCAW